jgi:hypothetical protein
MTAWFSPSLSQVPLPNNPHADTFGQPDDSPKTITTTVPSSLDPIVGVKEDTVGVFPVGLAHTPFPLIPSLPQTALGTQIGGLPKQRGWRKGGRLLEVMSQSLTQSATEQEAFIASKTATNTTLSTISHFSEGFYKGTLPDVLFVWGSDFAVGQALIDELRFYLQKLNTMGFLLNSSQLNGKGKTSVDIALPAIVLVGGGIWYHRFLEQLQQAILEVGFSYTEGKQLQQAVLGKVCRGAIFGLIPPYFNEKPTAQQQGNVLEGLDKIQSLLPENNAYKVKESIIRFKVAGGKNTAQRQVLHSLGRNGVVVSIENEGLSPVERLELQQLHEQLQHFVLPYAVAEQSNHKKDKKPVALEQYQQALSDAIFEMGLNRRAFESYEKGLVLSISPFQKKENLPLSALPADVKHCLALEILPHLQVVQHYMKAVGLTDTHKVITLCLAYLSK